MKTWKAVLHGAEFKITRLQESHAPSGNALSAPSMVVDYIEPLLATSVIYSPDVENFIVIHLNVRRMPIGFEVVSKGTLDTILVHPREVFKSAIVSNAASLVLVHNHPSGDPTPSEADIKVTRDLVRAGQLLKIEVRDHVILGRPAADRPKSWVSLRELGYLYS